MIDWIKTAQGVAAIVAAIFATMGAWWNFGLPRLGFSPELAPGSRSDRGARAVQPRHRAPGARPGLVARPSPRHALAGDGCGVRDVGWRRRAASSGAKAGRDRCGRLNARRREASVQSIGSAVVDVAAGADLELVARVTSGATRNVAGRR